MAKSQIEEAVEFLKERGWEFRPAQKIEGVFKPIGKYDAKNPAQDDFGIYDNKTLKMFAYHISLAESKGKSIDMLANIRDEYLVEVQKLRSKYINKLRN